MRKLASLRMVSHCGERFSLLMKFVALLTFKNENRCTLRGTMSSWRLLSHVMMLVAVSQLVILFTLAFLSVQFDK